MHKCIYLYNVCMYFYNAFHSIQVLLCILKLFYRLTHTSAYPKRHSQSKSHFSGINKNNKKFERMQFIFQKAFANVFFQIIITKKIFHDLQIVFNISYSSKRQLYLYLIPFAAFRGFRLETSFDSTFF